MEDPAWERELERRVSVYEQLEASGSWPGRLTSVDYLALTALAVVFTLGPWIWVH
jgi:hypothetical protein